VTFASLEFLVFLAFVMLLQRVLRPSMTIWALLGVSYVYYASGSFAGIVLILAISIADYRIGKALAATEDDTARRRLLLTSLVCNLAILGFFKYTNFVLANLQLVLTLFRLPVQIPRFQIPLPAGISYFTFTSMSYVLDIYYDRISPTHSPSEYLLYIAYFPKLLAGPIVRAGDFLSQIRTRFRASAADIEIGLSYFLLGAAKKVIIADQLGPHVDLIFASPGQYDGLTLLQGVLGYAVQIYCDFSGYSDMAIGCARLMGIRLPENFAMPYSATSITEFWRRWHITLSNWFRDYVFVPLEMATKRNPNPNLRASTNLVATMLLCGLWHGANWNFVFWGGLHGISLAINRMWSASSSVRPQRNAFRNVLSNLSSRVLTLGVVLLGWIFFRAESWSGALQYLKGIFIWQGGVRLLSPYILAGGVVVFLAHLAVDKDRNFAHEIPQWSTPARVAVYASLILMLSALGGTESAPFVYFQF